MDEGCGPDHALNSQYLSALIERKGHTSAAVKSSGQIHLQRGRTCIDATVGSAPATPSTLAVPISCLMAVKPAWSSMSGCNPSPIARLLNRQSAGIESAVLLVKSNLTHRRRTRPRRRPR